MINENLHTGHRERLRKRFQDESLDSFEDHQVLELLLFQVIPRGDTNPIAHRLCQVGQCNGCDFTGICRSDVASGGAAA